MIYVNLKGRIGNQLFMYAFAKKISMDRGNEEIVIYDHEVEKLRWKNSLMDYKKIQNVKYVHGLFPIERLCVFAMDYKRFIYELRTRKMSYREKYQFEKRKQSKYNKAGLIICENGFMDYQVPSTKNVYINGYFQSEQYFLKYSELIKNELNKDGDFDDYPDIDKIMNRNTICISIKVEHNVGNELYDVCSKKYWEKAIQYMIENVENPLFFICSDNVEYVKKNLIDCDKYDVVCQAPNYDVSVSMAVMSKCKHFVIGNTTFGWWAQYLCENQDKIVVAPSRWMAVDMPIDIYQDGWHLIDV